MNIEKLIALANYLDEIGLSSEADKIDQLVSREREGAEERANASLEAAANHPPKKEA